MKESQNLHLDGDNTNSIILGDKNIPSTPFNKWQRLYTHEKIFLHDVCFYYSCEWDKLVLDEIQIFFKSMKHVPYSVLISIWNFMREKVMVEYQNIFNMGAFCERELSKYEPKEHPTIDFW
jgi:hypothetical protein